MKSIIIMLLSMRILFAIDEIVLNEEVKKNILHGEIHEYTIEAKSNEEIKTSLTGLTDDADLYVKVGSAASADNYDCKSTHGGTTVDECSVTLENDDEVFILVSGYKTTNYTLKVIQQKKNEVQKLRKDKVLNDEVIKGETKDYTLRVKNGDIVTVSIDNLIADADIYIKVGEQPTSKLNDCKSTRGGQQKDECTITINERGILYIAVYGYRATTYDILATIKKEDKDSFLHVGKEKSGKVRDGEFKYYQIPVSSKKVFEVVMSELTADAELYVQVGSEPTKASYACRSLNSNIRDETCKFSLNDASNIYVGVYGYEPADFKLLVNIEDFVAGENMLENLAGGQINPNWVTVRGAPSRPIAHPNIGVSFPLRTSAGQLVYYTFYSLTVNDSINKVLELDLNADGGGRIHYGLGVKVQTLSGTRRMNWDSWWNHIGKGPHFGNANWLDYPAPVEMAYAGRRHFKVDLEHSLRLLEPNNRITKVIYFYTNGGSLMNIKLTTP